MKVIKRNGMEVDFDVEKIVSAISKANNDAPVHARISTNLILAIAEDIQDDCAAMHETPTVEDIQDMVEMYLMKYGAIIVGKRYMEYRYRRMLVRKANTTDQTIFELINGKSEYWNTENSNKNAKLVTTQRDYLSGISSTDIARRFLLPKDVVEAHDAGMIHVHDMDYMAENARHNCELINLEDMLQNGTVMNNVKIDKPKRILTATTIATQIVLGVSSASYGGATVSLTHLAPFVRSSYEEYLEKYKNWGMSDGDAEKYAMIDTKKEVKDSVQTFNYQVNSMSSQNGQSPFLSVCMYLGETDEYKEELAMLIEEFLLQRIQGFKNEKNVWVTPAFPKLLYILEEDNIHEDSKYWYLTELAAKCTAKRMVPDYISEKILKQLKVDKNGNGQCFPCMGCRSFLSPYVDADGNPKYYGRFNMGVVTINLAHAALSSGKDVEKFWKILDERLELCRKAHQVRYKRLAAITSDVAPILWQHGALARLEKGQTLESLVYGDYATISLGYAGLYECVYYMTGKSHTDPDAFPFAVEVMQHLNDKCSEWKAIDNVNYSPYGTPLEATTTKFAKSLKQFGDVPGITDYEYVTNSYHINVREKINAFDKLAFEASMQKLSGGGMISYVEVPNMQNNIPAVLQIIKYIYDTIAYAELNTKSDYCMNCGYDGEIVIVDGENGEPVWECPNCKNRDQAKMSVARRTCGYIGANYWNRGRTCEIRDRVLHVD